jgi:hypothetical protein
VPTYGTRKRFGAMRAPVLATIAIHLLFVYAWVATNRQHRDGASARSDYESVPLFVLPAAKPPLEKKFVPTPVTDRTRIIFDDYMVPDPPTAVAAVAPLAPTSPAPPAEVAGDPFAEPKSVHERALAQAGKVDRELRGNKRLVLTLQPDSFTAKLQAGIAAAHRGDMMGKVDPYTAPDGVIYTRMRRGSGTTCYMSGSVNFVPGILHSSEKPQKVNCPPDDAGWRG